MTRSIALLSVILITASGCASQREIETSRPRPREEAAGAGTEAARQARLIVALQQGRTELPDDVASLRFRVAEVRLHSGDGAWTRLPSDVNTIEFAAGSRNGRRTILDTRVAPAAYDSLAIALERVFVQFNENSGAPLATADGAPQRLALDLHLDRSVPTSLTLNLEVGASLTRSPDCSWFFVPVFRPEVEQGDASPADTSQP